MANGGCTACVRGPSGVHQVAKWHGFTVAWREHCLSLQLIWSHQNSPLVWFQTCFGGGTVELGAYWSAPSSQMAWFQRGHQRGHCWSMGLLWSSPGSQMAWPRVAWKGHCKSLELTWSLPGSQMVWFHSGHRRGPSLSLELTWSSPGSQMVWLESGH